MKLIVHKNRWFSIEKNIIENRQEYFVLSKKPAVFIIAETKDKELVLINEYRFPIKRTIWQLPAGMIEHGTELESAKRELFEETGLKAKNWQKLAYFFVAPGHENTKIIVFVARDLISNKNSFTTSEVNIHKIQTFSETKIRSMIRDNKILCSISLASLNLYFNS